MQYSTHGSERPQLPLFQEALFCQNLIPDLEPASVPVHYQHVSQLQLNASAGHLQLLLAPILRELSTDDSQRWLTLIAPPAELNLAWLRDARLNRERVIVLQPRHGQSAQDLTEQALRLGRSHSVVSWLDRLESQGYAKLERAASEGDTHLLCIEQR